MSDNLLGKRKRGGKKERGTPRAFVRSSPPVEEPPTEEPPLTYERYIAEKEKILRRAVLLETQFVQIRTTLRTNKIREAEEYKIAVSSETCPEFIAGKKDAEDALTRKNDINQTTLELKLAQILDEYEAENRMNLTQHDDKFIYARGRFIDFFKELIDEKSRRINQVGGMMAALLTLNPVADEVTEKPVHTEVVYKGRLTRSRSKSQKGEDAEKKPQPE